MRKILEVYDKDHIWYEGKQYISLKRVGEMIKEAKAVDAEPVKHGHWNTERNPMMYQTQPYVHVCSECGTAFPYEMPYCGECGSKMDSIDTSIDT